MRFVGKHEEYTGVPSGCRERAKLQLARNVFAGMEHDEIPTEAEQGLFLVTELGWLMERASLEDWPQQQADLFRQRLGEICVKSGLQSPAIH